MLVFKRRAGQEIQVGQYVRIVLVSITNRVARIGIEAPTHIPIIRGEVCMREEIEDEVVPEEEMPRW